MESSGSSKTSIAVRGSEARQGLIRKKRIKRNAMAFFKGTPVIEG